MSRSPARSPDQRFDGLGNNRLTFEDPVAGDGTVAELDPFATSSLDPADWSELRRQGHRMLDDMFDHIATVRDRPLWRAPSSEQLAEVRSPMPADPTPLCDVHAKFARAILRYSSGNSHPGFMGWVQGGGTAVGMLASMLGAGMNPNVGGRHHMAVELERHLVEWTRELFGFPASATGLFLTGTSAANFLAVLVARTRALGVASRQCGLRAFDSQLTAYAAVSAHGCIARAMEMAGIGRAYLRLIPMDGEHRIVIADLRRAITEDRARGLRPFLLIGTAGSVDVGAIDDLTALADLAEAEDLHLHIDGAFGALAMLSPRLAPRLDGIQRADSIAFDWHKWGQVPYDAGFVLVRDGALHRQSFAAEAEYLRRAERGLAAGDWWPCDYGPDLSRGFRALNVWFTIMTVGTKAIGRVIEGSVMLASRLAARIAIEPELELLAPVPLNIVCFGYRSPLSDHLNAEIVADLHEAGRVAPSLTVVAGRTAIRAAIVNHRTSVEDVDALVESVLHFGRLACERMGR